MSIHQPIFRCCVYADQVSLERGEYFCSCVGDSLKPPTNVNLWDVRVHSTVFSLRTSIRVLYLISLNSLCSIEVNFYMFT